MFLKYPSVIGTTPAAVLSSLQYIRILYVCLCTHVQKSLSKPNMSSRDSLFTLKYDT